MMNVWKKEEHLKTILMNFLNEFAGFVSPNETFIKKGIKFYELSSAEQDKWQKMAGPPIEKKWLEEMDKRGQGENARELLKRYKALIKKYEAISESKFIFPSK